jgi:hypothetical protein
VSSGGESIPPQRDSITLRSLETVDNGISVAVPELAVPNLSFRRLSHSQPIDWGEGITADLKLTHEKRLVGTIYNRTGRTLTNAYVLLQTSTRTTELRYQRLYERHLRNIVLIDRVAPGVTRVDRQVLMMDPASLSLRHAPGDIAMRYNSYLPGSYRPVPFYSSGADPVLVATISGEPLGPTIGQYVGGPDAVTVIVTLPPIRPAVNTAVKGGSK